MVIIPPVFPWMMQQQIDDRIEIKESERAIEKSCKDIDESIKGLAEVQTTMFEQAKAIAAQRDALFEENKALKAELAETKNVLRQMCERFDPFKNAKR